MIRKLAILLGLTAALSAHVGSPDVFYESMAGPYRLAVTIRPPTVIPGVAQVEVRALSEGVESIRITPTPLVGLGAKYPPVADSAQRSLQDPRYFSGAVWLMRSGSWQIRVQASGSKGDGQLSAPVPALANRTGSMNSVLGGALAGLGLLLSLGVVCIVGAAVRESSLEPSTSPSPQRITRSRIVMGITAVLVAFAIFEANGWWSSEANRYSDIVYKPLQVTASVGADGFLELHLRDPGWLRFRKVDDFLPDHGHLMHLYVLSVPGLERVWHLHPEMVSSGKFRQVLPPMPAGKYKLYGDVVHENGLPETLVTEMELHDVTGAALTGDDAAGQGVPIGHATSSVCVLPDGYRMVWDRDPGPLRTGSMSEFRFRLEDPHGKPVDDAELYMGMQGHAAFVKSDLTTFAHIHPSGSVPMAALQLVSNTADPHAGHHMMHSALPPVASFPYGLPKPGAYRAIVQMKRGGAVETGVFDMKAE